MYFNMFYFTGIIVLIEIVYLIMESIQESFPSVIQYYKGTEKTFDNVEGAISENSDNQHTSVSVDVIKLKALNERMISIDKVD